jgi:GMP synthase (glutamine-hydrolysing)
VSDKILLILHQEGSTPGRIGMMLRERGYGLDIRRPRFGDPLPETMAEHAGVIIFGGPMSANDEDDYLRREIDWISVPLSEKAPLFGICLGAQMMARQLGARVSGHPEGRVEVGYYPLRPTGAGAVLGAWPDKVYQWHVEGIELPRGAELLAEGDAFPVQAFRYGPAAFGVQFHPELTLAMMHRWTVRGAHRFGLPGAQHASAHFYGRYVHDAANKAWLSRFFDRWLDGKAQKNTGKGRT